MITLAKRALRKIKHEAWREGVLRCIERLNREAERTQMRDLRHAQGLETAADLLEGLLRRGR